MSDDSSRTHKWTVIGSLAGVAALVLAVVAYVYPPGSLGGGGSTSTTSSASPSSASSSPSSTPTSEPPPAPPLAAPPDATMADVNVVQHALLEGPRGQGQVKVKVNVHNRSDVALNASIANMRLLLRGDSLPGRWTPRSPTADWSVVEVGGNRYVAIPANANNQWEPEFATFASFWRGGTLMPGESYSGAGKDNGDLVFYAPADPAGSIPFGGIALVSDDGSTVLGWTEHLGDEADPRTF